MKRTGVWLAGLLVVAVLTSAIAVVFVKYQTRLLFVDLQALRVQRQDLDVEWDNLLLEQAAQANIASVERRARHHLDMHIPERSEMRLVEGAMP
jgi:cell division protein FtsL